MNPLWAYFAPRFQMHWRLNALIYRILRFVFVIKQNLWWLFGTINLNCNLAHYINRCNFCETILFKICWYRTLVLQEIDEQTKLKRQVVWALAF